MKRIAFLTLLILSVFGFNSCKDQIAGTEFINYASFEKKTATVVLEKNGTEDLVVKVYTTKITDADRTINIVILIDDSSADPAAYNVPSSVTIPANSNEGEFTISLSDVNISADGETVVVKLVGDNNLFTGDKFTVNLLVYCPLNIDDFLGDYIITEAGYGDYATTITKDPDVANRIWITNFWDYTNDLVYYDFDPVTGSVTCPAQDVLMGDGEVYNVIGSGTYNACNGTFHVEYQGDVSGTVHDFNPDN
jgi:hypothetical protein